MNSNVPIVVVVALRFLSLTSVIFLLATSGTTKAQFNLGQIGQQFGLGNLAGFLGGVGGRHNGPGQMQQQQPPPPPGGSPPRPEGGGPGGESSEENHQGGDGGPPFGRPFGGLGGGPGGGGDGAGQMNVGSQVEGLLNRIGLNQQLTHQLGGLINGVASRYFAPNPDSPIPPHVQRRIMRFCTRHPDHPKCQGHPEWVISEQGALPAGPDVGNPHDSINLNEMFPNLIPFQVPPIPRMAVRNFLHGVPDMLKQFVPANVIGEITAFARQAIESICAQRGDCMKQRPEFLNQRATIAEQEAIITRTLVPAKSIEQVDHDVELRLARTHQVKKALLKKAGLEGKVEPANNGVFHGDLLLTEEQANTMLNEINQNEVGVGVAPTGGRLKRAGNSLFLENAPNQRWPLGQTIPFMFDRSVSSEGDKSAVRAALNEIQSRVGCLRFQEVSSKPPGSHLYYVRINNPTFCGLSYVGRIEPANPIYLSFMCGNPMGVAIHETLHALGLQHEQLRTDRDKYITVNWENVNPQQYDFFAVSDLTKFSSYGIKYDYGSIMHYSSTIASQNFGKKTMTAKSNPAVNDPLMGQRNGMSASDIEELNRMYCMPSCVDKNVYCGVWATNDQCRTANGAIHGWMAQNCRKSCALCTIGTS